MFLKAVNNVVTRVDRGDLTAEVPANGPIRLPTHLRRKDSRARYGENAGQRKQWMLMLPGP